MSIFDRLVSSADGVVTSVMGTAAEILPRLAGRLSQPVADPARPVVTVTGVFTDIPAGEDTLEGQRQRGEFAGATTTAVSQTHLWLSRAEFARIPFALGEHDALRIGDRLFGIAKADPTDHGDVILMLTREPA